MVTVFSILVLWIISLCLHEYSHARVAYAGGDTSVVEKGYLSMNPLKYVHPVMSILIPVVILLIGGIPLPGGAVYIDTSRLRSRHWDAAVSAAGPAANLGFMALMGIPFLLGLPEQYPDTGLWNTLAFCGLLQAAAALLNLLPVPGLDGFGIIAPYLPPDVRRTAYQFSTMGFILLVMVLWNNASAQRLFWTTSFDLTRMVGISSEHALHGLQVFDAALSEILPFRS